MLSWKDSDDLNAYISEIVGQRTYAQHHQLTIIHHYYVAETAFPGLQVKFGYKDLALQPHWLDDDRLVLISGHIHHAFSYKNYLCVGAVRSTSPVEFNQLQYLFSYNIATKKVIAHQVALNPYLQIERQ